MVSRQRYYCGPLSPTPSWFGISDLSASSRHTRPTEAVLRGGSSSERPRCRRYCCRRRRRLRSCRPRGPAAPSPLPFRARSLSLSHLLFGARCPRRKVFRRPRTSRWRGVAHPLILAVPVFSPSARRSRDVRQRLQFVSWSQCLGYET